MMNNNILALLKQQLGEAKTVDLVNLMHISPKFSVWDDGEVSRAELAQVLNMLLFNDVLERVPSGKAYTEDVFASGEKVVLDHGALRTVRWLENGALPPGEVAITRILRPLGFQLNGVFPLDRLNMTGRSYAHQDDPDHISQFFVSELHPERFSRDFQEAVTRVLATSCDPLTPAAIFLLHELERDGRLTLNQAQQLLPILLMCFARQHATISESDYALLLKESAEMAWIATEGNVFNHATDRVADVFALSEEQKSLGRPMKVCVEVSASGRVKQTAFKADPVIRDMLDDDGKRVQRIVPGSFYEFISRDVMHDGDQTRLDLGFDAANAQGIFKMTANEVK
ncbi:DUF1338 domain-containing protein [Undibacterium seohonense]|uniref:2-oxoadipate dioxygenase/decarboxylase n=1 Tax=Undibacterium seohonense TaxID=1344950 RepID=A0ABR6X740_9BURK|nr:DUF1338 domain-containing protein [Undibacterium seohonense]MBC3808773.1 DUF1338 domain-containing protein [Undibacterium seohonense]